DAKVRQHQSPLFGAGIEEASSDAREAGSKIGGEPMFEGVTAIKNAVGAMGLAGDAVLFVPEPACTSTRLGRIEEASAVVACSDAGGEGWGGRLAGARLDDHLPDLVQSDHDAARHSSVSPSCLRRRTRITASSMEWRIVGHEISTGLRWP